MGPENIIDNLPDGTPAVVQNEILSVEVTTRCNSACGHCFVRAGRTKAVDLSPDLAAAIVSEGRSLGYRKLHITGGEPLLWEGLFGLIDVALTLGYESVFINSNGTLITDDIARRMAAYGDILSISISIQGPEQHHNCMRGSGSYKIALAGLERALAVGLKVYIFTVMTRNLLMDLPSFAEYLFTTYPGIKELILIQLIRVHEDAFNLSDDLLSPEDFIAMVRMAALLNLYGFRVSILQNPLAVVVSRALSMPWLAPAQPLHRHGGIIVMADRTITLAHSTRVSFGLYEPGVLKNVIVSSEYQTATGPDDMGCRRCDYIKLCREHGMVRPSEWYRDMVEGTPYCRRVLQSVSSMIDRSGTI